MLIIATSFYLRNIIDRTVSRHTRKSRCLNLSVYSLKADTGISIFPNKNAFLRSEVTQEGLPQTSPMTEFDRCTMDI